MLLSRVKREREGEGGYRARERGNKREKRGRVRYREEGEKKKKKKRLYHKPDLLYKVQDYSIDVHSSSQKTFHYTFVRIQKAYCCDCAYILPPTRSVSKRKRKKKIR